MTEPNMEWEDEFERAWMRTIYKGGFLQEHTNIPQAILVKSFIRQAISQAEQRGYEKGVAEERERIAAVAKKINKLVRGEWEWKLYCNSTGMAMSQKQANELINELINIHDTK